MFSKGIITKIAKFNIVIRALMGKTIHVINDNNPGLSTMPFNARREALLIGFAYHSLLKLDKSGKTQISASRPWQANQRKKVKTGRKGLPLTTRPLSDPDRFTGAEALRYYMRTYTHEQRLKFQQWPKSPRRHCTWGIDIKGKKKRKDELDTILGDLKGRRRDDVLRKIVPNAGRSDRKWPITHGG